MEADPLDTIKKLAVVIIVGLCSVWLLRNLMKTYAIKKKIRRKQDQCLQAKEDMEKQPFGLTQRVQANILKLSFTELQDQLQSGKLKPLQALEAYMAKAKEANKHCNFMVEPVKEARAEAEKLDKKKDKGVLHGIPISIKENYFIKGYDSTGGMSTLIGKPAKEDGVLLKVLRELGAIPYVRTNIPQSMMTFECSNPIYGTTVNPHNHSRGPGGSSGGEGAILGSEASILGWGSDIGGSLRIPSHFCGVYCLKPTAGRLSLKTCEELDEGLMQTLIRATPGPMGRDVDTIAIAMKAVLCDRLFELDPDVPRMPFNDEVYKSQEKLRIGYYTYDGYVHSIPGVERGVMEAKQALENLGHTLVEFQVPDVEYMFGYLFSKACFGDGSRHFMDMMGRDVVDPSIELLYHVMKLPHIVQTMLSYVITVFAKEKVPGWQLRSMQGARNVSDWWKLAGELEDYRRTFIKRWKDHRLDALVCPTMPYVAPPTGTVKFMLGGVTYTTLYNVLNFPSGCVPVTKVTAIDQKAMENYPTKTQTEAFIKKYFSADTAGLPVAVQCVALPYQEEMALRVMKDLETVIKKK